MAAEALTARLRELEFVGEILVIDRDKRMPYERPPLSKQFLTSGEDGFIEVEWEQQVEMICAEAVGVDVDSKTLELITLPEAKPLSVGFKKIVITTGASPFHLPIEPEGVWGLRTVDDAEKIRQAALKHASFGVIGAGAIGVELASSLSNLGVHVTLFDKADWPLERLLAGHLGETVASWLREIGVTCEFGADIKSISGVSGDWQIQLGDKRQLKFGALISAVGARPTVGWLADSGLLIDGQLICDSYGRVLTLNGFSTDVYGAGDVVTRKSPTGTLSRTESWAAASEQGMRLAEFLTHVDISEGEEPYFWTDVAGRKIQVFGSLSSDSSLEIDSENPERGSTLYRATAPDGTIGWIGINAQQAIAKLRMGLGV